MDSPILGYLRVTLIVCALLTTFCIAGWGLVTNPLQITRSPPRESDVRDGARRFIVGRPFDPVGWLAWLGTAFGGAGQLGSPRAAHIIDSAALLGPVDPQVLRAQALLALHRGEIAAGLGRTAEFALMFPTEQHDAFTTLRAYVNDPVWSPFLQSQLDKKWPAITAFLQDSCQSGMPLSSLLSLSQQVVRRQPLSEAVVSCIGNRAIAESQIPAAYWLWVNALPTLPATIGNVFNGDFELPLADRLFDWRLSPGGEYREGFVIAVRNDETRRKKNRVLSVSFNGRPLRTPVAQQYLALEPARYTFAYAMRPTGLPADSAVAWTLRCIPAATSPALGEIKSSASAAGWISKTQEITIPPGCSGQVLELDLGSKLQMMQGMYGSVLFDDISLTRRLK